MKPNIGIVNSLDPRCAILELAGYSLIAESWGAHLNTSDTFDLFPYKQRVGKLNLKGFQIQELSVDFAMQVFELELATNIDYPQTPATEHAMPPLNSILDLWRTDTWIFGALYDYELVGIISASQKNN